MGGTVVVTAFPTLLSSGYRIAGAVVLDVVEGVIYSLPSIIHLTLIVFMATRFRR